MTRQKQSRAIFELANRLIALGFAGMRFFSMVPKA
jgi:hypothetical protein